jgi:hypothetical protein
MGAMSQSNGSIVARVSFDGTTGDLELDQIAPERDPLLQQARVVALHELEAALEARLDPAVDVAEPLWGAAAPIAQAAIHRLGVAVPETLDHHEQHGVLRRIVGGPIVPGLRLRVMAAKSSSFSANYPRVADCGRCCGNDRILGLRSVPVVDELDRASIEAPSDGADSGGLPGRPVWIIAGFPDGGPVSKETGPSSSSGARAVA